jgi:hypothetical protein
MRPSTRVHLVNALALAAPAALLVAGAIWSQHREPVHVLYVQYATPEGPQYYPHQVYPTRAACLAEAQRWVYAPVSVVLGAKCEEERRP